MSAMSAHLLFKMRYQDDGSSRRNHIREWLPCGKMNSVRRLVLIDLYNNTNLFHFVIV
jgi:hypothetical protein